MRENLLVAARIRVMSGLVLLGFVAAAVGVQADPVAASSVITTTYSYTGATQTFTVPPGVTSITVTLKGGQGGRGGGDSQGAPMTGGYQGVVTGRCRGDARPSDHGRRRRRWWIGTSSQERARRYPRRQPAHRIRRRRRRHRRPGRLVGWRRRQWRRLRARRSARPTSSPAAPAATAAAASSSPIVGRRAEETHTARPDAVVDRRPARPQHRRSPAAPASTATAAHLAPAAAAPKAASAAPCSTAAPAPPSTSVSAVGRARTRPAGFDGPHRPATASTRQQRQRLDHDLVRRRRPGAPINLVGTAKTGAVGLGVERARRERLVGDHRLPRRVRHQLRRAVDDLQRRRVDRHYHRRHRARPTARPTTSASPRSTA